MVPLMKTIPLPEPEKTQPEDRRLWIGNLDPRITEYQLLKIIEKYGAIDKFDLLFHKSGPLAGQPRGYAFVTYTNTGDALRMKELMNGVQLGTKCITVRWAHSMDKMESGKTKSEAVIPALGVKVEKKMSPALQIKAIEAKLKMMEHTTEEEFRIVNAPSSSLPTASNPLLLNSKKPSHLRSKPYVKTNQSRTFPSKKK